MNTNKKTYEFQSETNEILHLMVHSLYSNKEIFLRELISNASDAIDKLKFKSISSPELYEQDHDMHIRVYIDKKNNSLTISDNGIGMTYQEIINNLGTIAKSGTKEFLKSYNKLNQEKNNLIGKFGVGFYSAFIVSKKIIVESRFGGLNKSEGVLWESEGKGKYEVSKINKENRGTDIILYLKPEEKFFLESWNIKNIINKYSNHISVPIEINVYDEKKQTNQWEQINQAQALWTLKKSDITDEDYKNFYKQLTHDTNDPIIWTHNKIEGAHEYTILLFIPSKSAWDIWNRENKHGLKLYVKRIYIMDDAEQFLPNYLRFVKGIIDSNNLPLNVSREVLQDNQLTKNLKKTLTKRILKLLHDLSKDKNSYKLFWSQFGLVLKEGPAENPENRDLISNLLRFYSMQKNSIDNMISLKDYVSNMNNNQEKIYFITADNYSSAINSPHLEFFKKNNIDVLLLTDKIDEWMMNYLTEFDGKKFQSVSKHDESIEKLNDNIDNSPKNLNNDLGELLNRIKSILKQKIKDVRFTNKLTHTPAMVITDSNDMTTQMAKLFSAAGQTVPEIKYIFEINPNHELIKKISQEINEEKFKNWIKILFDQSILLEKNTLENPSEFITRINNILINCN
ncbi:molecular chaperone HtpG [Buchnera aphidicola]|uniref:Chaperone protein HtpG n=1 Tax=Buchnera aphidicola subsp. Melaphis rhois TaxID=118103 RepID=A0A4D6YBQ8_BUCMH|nr:molecular chaperone HtpG [Buchnera aphidicola]QCI23444.1 molecular chaperone HtpG [Buchnera aphidicola (Melaphis rhois)]